MKSIRARLFLGIVGLVVGYVLLSWLLNSQLLDVYYHRIKTNSLVSGYKHVKQAYDSGDLAQLLLDLETMERKEGLMVVIVDSSYTLQYASRPVQSARHGSAGPTGPMDSALLDSLDQQRMPPPGPGPNPAPNPDPFPVNTIERAIADLEGEYEVLSFTRDDRLKLDFISLIGRLPDGGYVFLSAPISSIEESASAANRFFLVSGVLMIAVGSIAAYWYAGRFTQPIHDMKVIAERVAKLDFSMEYVGSTDDEIGALGESINIMSRQLEYSINELVRANERLQQDIERERQIDEMRKEFIANVSHELKTPIALIQGYSEGLKLNVNDDEENRDFYCDVITDEAARMNRLVGQLLKLAQIESGNIAPRKICFDIVEFINHIVRKNGLALQERGVDLGIEGESCVEVVADIDMMEQVLVNYITNGIDHCDGERKMTITIEEVDEKARISVFNTGQHIPEDCMDSIWTSFYKTDKARTRDHGGTGLGLSIVKAVQKAHGNDCGCKNVAGGVVFWFDADLC
ncbi:MAG TPA: HAMP domain-containing sensor histidine kinase [Bacillota bacterium]|nr:HAMP domain-containing sensor histidine kinase [Bacillota bacterium]